MGKYKIAGPARGGSSGEGLFVLRFVRQFVWILLFTLLGEGLHAVLPLLILIVLSTLLTFALSGKVTQLLMPKEEKGEPDHD